MAENILGFAGLYLRGTYESFRLMILFFQPAPLCPVIRKAHQIDIDEHGSRRLIDENGDVVHFFLDIAIIIIFSYNALYSLSTFEHEVFRVITSKTLTFHMIL